MGASIAAVNSAGETLQSFNGLSRDRRRSHPQDTSLCQLGRLPHELILAISSELSPGSRILLSQTCRLMHRILQNANDVAAVNADACGATRLEFVSCLARDLPDRWACHDCALLHAVDPSDVQGQPMRKDVCYYGLQHKSRARASRDPGLPLPNLRHHHVQLALKFARMGRACSPSQRRYLKRLLAPFQPHGSVPCLIGSPSRWRHVHYAFYPKIAVASDGRPHYLLLTVMRFGRQEGVDLTTDTLGEVDICAHKVLGAQTDPPGFGRMRLFSSLDSREAVDSCHRCPTDFATRITRSAATISVWQDLGPEGCSTDPIWTSHVQGWPAKAMPKWRIASFKNALATWRDTGLCYVGHESGSVRRNYEGNL